MSLPKKIAKIQKLVSNKTHLTAIFVIVFAVAGASLLIVSHAASPNISIEVESGIVTTPAAKIDDPSASSGKALQFNAPKSSAQSLAGVNVHATWNQYTDAERIDMLDQAKAAHLKWIRIDIGWSTMEQHGKGTAATPGAGGSKWYLDRTSYVVDAAKAKGLKVLLTLTGSPDWSHPGQTGNDIAPDNPQDYADFANFIAGYYKDRVDAWEVWNEPNLVRFWNPVDPVKYADLVKVAYPAIKQADPNTIVVVGAVSANDDSYLSSLYQNGIHGYFDVLSTHPYLSPSDLPPEQADSGSQDRITHVTTIRNLMNSKGDSQKDIWFTEFGWSSHANTGNEPGWQRGVSEAVQADYTVRALQFVKANYSYVTAMFIYDERNESSGSIQTSNRGITYADGSIKPVYSALQQYLATQ